mmetsp:Transcript_43854/g.94469  ORF Transcript_43854/g.94469 Transcript_43854/m.94469 type:complete len:121 (+) Transcript_43854:357-719(+)
MGLQLAPTLLLPSSHHRYPTVQPPTQVRTHHDVQRQPTSQPQTHAVADDDVPRQTADQPLAHQIGTTRGSQPPDQPTPGVGDWHRSKPTSDTNTYIRPKPTISPNTAPPTNPADGGKTGV